MTELQLPAHLANRASRNLAASAVQGLSTGSPPYISIQGNRFTLVDAAGNKKPTGLMDPKLGLAIDVTIIDANPHVSKVYYDTPFDPNAAEYVPPSCWSDNGEAPSTQAAKPQCAACSACPHNQWGSSTSRMSGKPVKACQDTKKLAVLVPGETMPFLLRVPPNSLKHLGAYVKSVAGRSMGSRSVDLSDLMTRISFAPEGVGTLQFAAVAWVDEKTAAQADALWAAKGTDTLVGKTDLPRQGALPAPAVPPAGNSASVPAVAPPPAPPAASVAPPVVAEEPKRRGRKAKEDAPAAQAPFMPAATPAAGAVEDIPDFLRRDAPAAAPPAPKAPGVQHGMVQQPAAPDADLMAALNSAMGLPT